MQLTDLHCKSAPCPPPCLPRRGAGGPRAPAALPVSSERQAGRAHAPLLALVADVVVAGPTAPHMPAGFRLPVAKVADVVDRPARTVALPAREAAERVAVRADGAVPPVVLGLFVPRDVRLELRGDVLTGPLPQAQVAPYQPPHQGPPRGDLAGHLLLALLHVEAVVAVHELPSPAGLGRHVLALALAGFEAPTQLGAAVAADRHALDPVVEP
mmetsp:Transcript_5910/g.16813  ORF Transcript_5910/g.16813 Transcript_5910/m.16813 type:complete len:213 (+) Transcript_5910:192-830(+)